MKDMEKTAKGNINRILSYKELKIWQRSMDIVKEIYHITKNFPASAQSGLLPQMRQAAIAVPSNIADGYSRQSSIEFRRYLAMSRNSLLEFKTQVLLCKRLGYLEVYSADKLLPDIREVSKMLATLLSRN
jgi:four helix bundle protein